jgi:3-oxoacyl-[acyl-carrier-protein] synthase-3
MTCGVITVASHVPSEGLSAVSVAEGLSVPADFVQDKLGTDRLPRIDGDVQTSDLAVSAVEAMAGHDRYDPAEVRVLVVVTQNPDGRGLPHTAAIVASKLGLGPDVAAFDVSLGCSGFVYGLQIVEGLLAKTGGTGLLVTADPYSKIVDPDDRDTVLLFGDASAATLIGPDPKYRIGAARLGTDGAGAPHLCNRDGVLHMAGRQVFNFAATRVPREVKALLESEGLGVSDIDLALLHQGSRYIVETLADRIGLDRSITPIDVGRTGNTVSSSIPLLLEPFLATPPEDLPRRILMAGFGVGFSWGVGMLERA